MTRLISCCRCKIEFHVPDYWETVRRQDNANFWCPNGHQQHFPAGETDETKLRRERDRLKQQLAQKDDEISSQKRQVIAAKGQVTKLTKRISNGICPCCTRSFTNLARHMATKHPELTKPKLVCEAS